MCCRVALLSVCYLLPHVWASMLIVPFLVVSSQEWRKVALALVVLHLLYFTVTLRGRPAVSGCRKLPQMLEWVQRELQGVFEWWMGSCKVRNISAIQWCVMFLSQHRCMLRESVACATHPVHAISLIESGHQIQYDVRGSLFASYLDSFGANTKPRRLLLCRSQSTFPATWILPRSTSLPTCHMGSILQALHTWRCWSPGGSTFQG